MPDDFLVVVIIAGIAALSSLMGGLIALWMRTATLILSIAVGGAAGILLGTFSFEMLPQARNSAGLMLSASGFILGFLLIYGFDLYLNRGLIVGDEADERPRMMRLRKHRERRGSDIVLLAGGTSIEELVEGVSIGVGIAADPGLGAMIGIAIAIDNVSEALSIGELIRAENSQHMRRRILGWTGLIGLSVFVSALLGWLFLRAMPPAMLGFLLALGAGGMFYLTVTDLLPKSEKTQFRQSAGLATAAGFLLMFMLSGLNLRL